MIPEAEDQTLEDLAALLWGGGSSTEIGAEATIIVARRLGRIERELRDLTEAVRENTRFGK